MRLKPSLHGCLSAALLIAATSGCSSMQTNGCATCSAGAGDICATGDGLLDHKVIAKLRQDAREFDHEQLNPDHCWPDQYARESRRRVNSALGAQARAGNDIEMTVWEHYFEKEKGLEDQLTDAGKHRIKYLARKRPYVINQLYLPVSFDPSLDSRRINNVVAYANSVSTEPQQWQVATVNRVPSGVGGYEGSLGFAKTFQSVSQTPHYESASKSGFLGGGGGGGGDQQGGGQQGGGQ
jgi:hypothetical protein